ncbi:peptide-methionine (S)-S-oxide reductase MsrA [Rhodoferax saidenbachensis]|uniref:peptide-methionine (S)-S-oxide reductase MsrA n=1 Tax=Rhodoferax saidenbachensis TaxID=1484693 RepID=UPI0009DFBEA0|nr:peptide-methionine (S)-S-oxide reductase MsrA [Rhodoferax saidenbachensis]
MKTPPASNKRSSLSSSLGKTVFLLVGVVLVLGLINISSPAKAEKAVLLPAPSAEVLAAVTPAAQTSETAVFAGGCFWGVQAVFQHTQGVLSAVSGYAGGSAGDADYNRVSGGGTGHAEAVQVRFDPKQISYAQLLQIFFSVAHDPTQLNRQYPDVGPQYRSAIFYTTPAHKLAAERYMAQLGSAKTFPSPIVTQLAPLQGFYAAEAYHQNYATLHPESGYIAQFDRPKIANLQALLPAVYRAQPVLVP